MEKFPQPEIMPKKITPVGDESKPSMSAYTFDELRELWYISMIQGATLWQYCQDNKKKLPVDFDKGLELIRTHVVDVDSIKFLLSNRFALLGLFNELLSNSTSNTTTKGKKKI